MKKIAVCVSGGGTNLQAILNRIADGTIGGVKVSLVVSNNKKAYALERAKQAGIPAVCVSRREYGSREEFEAALVGAIDQAEVDFVVLAGFLVIIPEEMIRRYRNRILNIHPSLIPSFCGTGYYGLKVHEAVLARGAKVTGATVHIVDEGTDTGPIILQKAVEDDTPEVLQRRVMEEAEWKILPEAIHLFANDQLEIRDGRVYQTEEKAEKEAIC